MPTTGSSSPSRSNDTIEESGAVRVDPARCLESLAAILDESRRRAITPLVVGPPPVITAGAEHLTRTAKLAAEMSALCQSQRIPFIATTMRLADDPVWTREVLAGDGAHPGSGGYQQLADLILADQWQQWTTQSHT